MMNIFAAPPRSVVFCALVLQETVRGGSKKK